MATEQPVIPPLRDVPGPSALGGGWRRSWELLYLIAAADFKRTYFGTALGYLWSVCRPLLLFGVLLAVFTQAFKVNSGVPHYAELLLANIVLFNFFSETTGAAVVSVVGQEAIVRKTQFPRLVIPMAVVLTNIFQLALNLLVVFTFMLVAGVHPHWTWLLLPVLLAMIVVLTSAVSMIVSSLYPRFRDVGIIWTVASTALFYATPVLYPLTTLPERFRHIISLNPLAPIFALVHKWLIDPSAPSPASLAGGEARLLIPIAIYVAVCAFAVWIFMREAPHIAEAL